MTDELGTATDTGAQKAEENVPQANPVQKQEPGSVPYSRFAEVVEQRKGLESTLNSLIDGMVNELPEDMRDLVPNLPPAEKAVWIRTAKERGLFSRPGAAPASSPDPKRPSGKPTQDLSGLSPLAKLQRAYGNK